MYITNQNGIYAIDYYGDSRYHYKTSVVSSTVDSIVAALKSRISSGYWYTLEVKCDCVISHTACVCEAIKLFINHHKESFHINSIFIHSACGVILCQLEHYEFHLHRLSHMEFIIPEGSQTRRIYLNRCTEITLAGNYAALSIYTDEPIRVFRQFIDAGVLASISTNRQCGLYRVKKCCTPEFARTIRRVASGKYGEI